MLFDEFPDHAEILNCCQRASKPSIKLNFITDERIDSDRYQRLSSI